MLKKLLVAVVALTFIVGLCSQALAGKAPKSIDPAQLLEQAQPRIESGLRTSPGCTQWVNEYYYSGYNYFWALPDAYGDDYFNTRFTNDVAFELGFIEFTFYKPGSVIGVGATFYVWNSDITGFPNLSSVIYSVPINPIVWGGNLTWVNAAVPDMPAFMGDFNVGYSPIVNVPGEKLAIISDAAQHLIPGSELRSSEYWGLWGTMLADWGLDVSFAIDVYKCVTPDPVCPSGADPLDQWPVWSHDFGRSAQSGIALGSDICGFANAWTFDLGLAEGAYRQIARTTPLIYNDRVYIVYVDRIICLDLLTGAPLWTSKTLPWGAAVSGLLSAPAIVDGYLYMGTGTVTGPPAGFIKIDAATGALIWGRGAGLGTNLESTAGPTQISPPVIMGNFVYFGNQTGTVFSLDVATGATVDFVLLPPDVLPSTTAKMMGSVSADVAGGRLFVGTASATAIPVANGRVYCFTPVAGVLGAPTWVYNQPAAVLANYPGGFWSAPSYRCGNLFINSVATRNATTGFSGYRQNLDPATGLAKWYSNQAMGGARNAPPGTMSTVDGVVALFANYLTAGYNTQASARGVRAVSTFNNTLWVNPGAADGYENHVYCAAASTQDPWVFYGTADPYAQNALKPAGGFFVITDGLTGNIFAQYALSGMTNGAAIAHGSDGDDYVVVTTQLQYSPTVTVVGSGLVMAFKDQGPRPRLVVPETYVAFPSTNDAEAFPGTTVQRTANDAFLNTGCATMTYTTALSDGALLGTKLRSISVSEQERAANLAASLIDRAVEDLTPIKENFDNKFLLSQLVQNEEGDWYMPATAVKPAAANSARLAVPDWVTWVTGETGSVLAGQGADFTFEFDLTLMNKLGVNIFYVELSTDDPDYNPELWPDPQGVQAEIAFSLPYMYCATTIDDLFFGDFGAAWTTNIGILATDPSVAFTLDGADDALFAGTEFWCNDMPSAAWNPIAGDGTWDPLVDGGFLYGFYPSGDDCGGCVVGGALPVEYTTDGGLTYPALLGDICTWAMVDSGQDMGYYPHQDGPSMGLLIYTREVGAYGPDFANFKLTVHDVTNRNATNINGLYYGAFADWDVGAADAGNGDAAKGYIYQYEASGVYGFIGLPSEGSYWNTTGAPTDPMYNGHILHSADDYWDNEQFDSLYQWNDAYPEGSITIRPVETAGTDRAMHVAFGKADIGPMGQHSYGFATFGILGAWTTTDLDNLTNFVNKFAGFGRGDVDNNNVIDLRDLVRLQRYLNSGGPGPEPFKHLGDVNCDGLVNNADVSYLATYFFAYGAPAKSKFVF